MMGVPVLMLLAAAAFGGDGYRFDDQARPVAQRATKTFEIAIDGSPGVKVVVACLVDWGDEVDVVTLKGEVPQRRKVEAVGISCQIKKLGQSGKLMVEISRDGRVVSRNVSSGSSSVITVQLQ